MCTPISKVIVYLCWYKHIGVSWESLKEWKEFLCLAIPGLFMVCGEWWILDIGIFVTGNVSGAQLAAYNITLNLLTSGFVVMLYPVIQMYVTCCT